MSSELRPWRMFPRPRVLLFGVSILLVILLAVQAFYYVTASRTAELVARAEIEEATREAVAGIDAYLASCMKAADDFAAELTAHPARDRASLEKRMTAFLAAREDVYGSTVSYRPGAGPAGTGRYAPYIYHDTDRMRFLQLEDAYEYETKDWFVEPMKGGSRWTEPYFDEALSALMVTYSTRFYDRDATTGETRPAGVVTVDITMDQLVGILEAIDLGPSGYPALTTGTGRYLYHPTSEYVAKGQTLDQVGQASNDQSRILLAEKVRRGESGVLDHRSVTTGRSAWLFYAPIPSTGWSLQNTFTRDAIPVDADAVRRSLVIIIVIAVLLVMVAGGLIVHVENGEPQCLKRYAVFVLLALVAGVGFIWKAALDYPPARAAGQATPILSRSTLAHLQKDFVELCRTNNLQPPSFVPTGLYIDAIRFESPNDIVLSGHIWQKYSVREHAHLQRGIAFPGAERVDLVEVYRGTLGGEELVRWRFSVTLREKMDYTRYPIDEGAVRFIILHKDLNHNVVLVPDVASYRILTPTLLPGVAPSAFAPGWLFRATNFALVRQARGTSFGEHSSVSKENFPALAFDIRMRRDFVNAFISSLTPLLVVGIMLFTILCIAHQIDIGRFLSICVGMFFVITFNHLDVRRRIAAQEIFYLEWFYFLIYALILCVSLVAIFVHAKEKPRIVAWRNNVIAKLLYWPVLAGVLFLATAIYFA